MGDIHGMYDELMLLINSSGFDPAVDTLVALGDYIDRGNDSRKVIEFFMDLKAHHGSNVTLLKGNHEDMCVKARRGSAISTMAASLEWMNNGGDTTLQSFGVRIPGKVLSFLKQLPYYAETEQYIFVHAGVDPFLPLAEMKPDDLMWSSSHLPHCSGKMVIVGHAIRDVVTYVPWANTLYIDTGACNATIGRNGRLSMVDLTNNVVHFVTTGGSNPGTYAAEELHFSQQQ
jgi:serine/threonine protein phosphatase 1